MTKIEEVAAKLMRVRELLKAKNMEGVLLTKRGNFAWLTAGGDNHVVSAGEGGVASLLVTPDRAWLLTDNIESPRIQTEELAGLGFEPFIVDWYAGGREAAITKKAAGMKLGSDMPFAGAAVMEGEIARLRWSLLAPEISRYQWLGQACARAMTETCREIRPQMSEFQVGAEVSARLMGVGVEPHVVLVAADERIGKYRHPIPTENKVGKCCMVVICGQRWGLVLSMTRLVHFGPIPEELKRRHQAVARIDAEIIAATKPGLTAGKLFSVIKRAYAEEGFPEEWKLHHQGGATGYAGRDWKASREDDPTPVVENQAYAWNPSITGTKSEDTIIVGSKDIGILSATPELPAITIQTAAGPIKRAEILVV